MQSRFFELSHDMLCVASTDARFVSVNGSWTRTLGWTAEQLTSVTFLEFVHPEDLDRTVAEAGRLAEGEPTVGFRNRYRHADGGYRWVDWRATPDLETGEIYAAARDVTDSVALEESLRERERLLTDLVRSQLRARDEEHRRISGELHDSAVQHCVAALMHADDILEEHPEALGPVRTALSRTREEAARALDCIRRVMHRLDPFDIAGVDLHAALSRLAADASERYGIAVHVSAEDSVEVQGELLEVLYRCAAEGVANAGKHAKASAVIVTVRAEGNELYLDVADDGVGIAPDRASGPGTRMGLALATERVRACGGELQLLPAEPGTVLTVRVPLAS